MKSDQINELATALAKAQAKIRGAVKDSANPFFKSSYADLQSVWDAIREPLAANGLAVVQTTDTNEAGQLQLVTTLMHSSGQWIQGRFPILPLKQEPQAIGSATSYARRYALAALVGVYQTDDDAEQAQARGPTVSNRAPTASSNNTGPKPAPKVAVMEPKADQQVISETIDKVLATHGTGGLGAPFDLIISKGQFAGKQILELSLEEAEGYFKHIDGELRAVNRSPSTLRGPGRDLYYTLAQYVELKKEYAQC
jgi:hypothetical protein